MPLSMSMVINPFAKRKCRTMHGMGSQYRLGEQGANSVKLFFFFLQLKVIDETWHVCMQPLLVDSRK